MGVWEIKFPPARVTLTDPTFCSSAFRFTITAAIPGNEYQIQASTNLRTWTSLTTVIATTNTFRCTNATANPFRFYRAYQP